MSFPRPYGRYILDERIAMGGMAEIFRARTSTEGFEKRICIKRILPHYLESDDFVTMFRDEAALAARLQHGNVVQVFDFGTEEGSLYLAMEFIDGADLKRLLSIAARRGEAIGIGHAVQIAVEMCRGLHHAHTLTDAGRPLEIVHRDISPHNVLISRAGEVKVTDFGIAKAAARATHTGTGVVKGKLSYMAPEQALGKAIDHRVDQFATAIVLWEMLTGQRLFGGDEEVSILRKVMQCEVVPPRTFRPDLPADLEGIVLKALAAEPEARYADMRAFERALTKFLYTTFDDPAESDLRALVTRLLDESAPARKTAVLPQAAPAVEAPKGTIELRTGSVFTSSGESGPVSRSESIPISVEGTPVDPRAPTQFLDSASMPVASAEGTGATRTVVPDGMAVPQPAPAPAAEPSQPSSPAPAAELSGPSRVDTPAPSSAPRPRPNLLFAAGGGVLALGVVVGIGLALAGGDEAGDDQVLVTPLPRAASATTTEPSTTEPATTEPATAEPATAPPTREPSTTSTTEPGATASNETASDGPAIAAQAEGKPTSATPDPEPVEAKPDERSSPTPRKSEKRDEARSERKTRARPRGTGKVYIEMKRGWANAYLGSRFLCETPCTVELPTGTQWIRLEGPEGKEQRHRVVVKSDQLVRAAVPPFK